jgi:CpeT protein
MRVAFPFLAICLSLLAHSGCTSTRVQADVNSDLNRLMELMTGTFTSRAQASQDSIYAPIVLHMYPIWSDRGAWLYVEQALASRPDQPYRQRIYHLEQLAAVRFRSVVYTLPNPSNWVGAWREPERFDKLSPLELEVRSGCDVYLNKTGRYTFTGSTDGSTCRSEMAGAAYATSEVTITKNRIVSWDRGFDAQGEQVWGATEGGYVFKRK